MTENFRTIDLFDCRVPYLEELFQSTQYPWELLPKISPWIDALLDSGIPGFTLLRPGLLVGENVKIAATAVIEGKAVLGHGCELRPGAYLRGNVITGCECVLGNSSEFKNCILLNQAALPHYNYVGDSVIGNHGHLGAGAVCSNLKTDGKPVVIHGMQDYPTHLRKVGGMVGDGADVGCGCVLNPGTIVGKHTSVYPLTALRGVYPADVIVKSAQKIVPRD